jgi:hypothetical protein
MNKSAGKHDGWLIAGLWQKIPQLALNFQLSSKHIFGCWSVNLLLCCTLETLPAIPVQHKPLVGGNSNFGNEPFSYRKFWPRESCQA